MIKKSDFIWHIGFQGNTAIVNRRQKAAVRTLDAVKLLDAGELRAAFCAALWEQDVEKKEGSLDTFMAAYANKTGVRVARHEDLRRTLGVYQVPTGNLRVNLL